MTRKVIAAAPDTTIDQIAALLIKHRISAVPIVDQRGNLVGLVSEGDLMRRVEGSNRERRAWWLSLFSGKERTPADFIKERGRHARDIMTKNVRTVAPETTVGEIAQILERHQIKRVPVVESGRLVGIVSRANLLHALAAVPVSVVGAGTGDRQLRESVMKALSEVPGLTMAHINVIIEQGRIHVWGIAHSDAEEQAARVAVESLGDVGEVVLHFGRVPEYAWGM
jgi:CBS domain-containing protein